MNRLPETQIGKISSTLEELRLDRKAYHLLKRTSIHHVSSIILRGESGILNIKGMGTVTFNHIVSAVARHLNIPENKVFGIKAMQDALAYEQRPFDPLEAPVSILSLSASSIETLNSLGMFVMRDLLHLKEEAADGYNINGFRKTEIRKVYTELNLYLSKYNQLNLDRKPNNAIVIPTVIDLSTILATIVKNERTLRIIDLRASKLLTLEEIAVEVGGVSRERIRQIIDQVHNRVHENLNLLKIFCDFFEGKIKSIDKELNEPNLAIDALVKQCKLYLPAKLFSATEEELRTLIIIIRLLVIHDKTWIHEFIYKRWEKFAFLACIATPSINGHEVVNKTLVEKRLRNKKLSYKELALSVLSKERRPMHWSEIVDIAYHLERRDSFNSTALYNALMRYPNLFVRVNAGTYALVEWGFSHAETYPDIIASILKSSKKPLSAEAIYHKVNEIRQVKQSTLIMLLDMHPRFYKSLQNTYGLRIWLPPREKQTLRTPEWLVENSDSYKRLEQASQRGYNIENMIQADLNNT